ncbi:hypothetical protein PPTG_15609 [Phytophthora nicotianae INRA-310]|uniref:DUF6570 domain-containing protein n=1 Tax=Phytophthora nicotianae (strain INRA-310) TaxID=761204 RepID=W2PSL1_PHYN3|nr:hypothetical protein PPTG_15609 [Phytophthora nicotianae INRA-310]ETN03636.1 hypothetical protein PPTG_15609 [Phytophthora nicotianae INRA-310]
MPFKSREQSISHKKSKRAADGQYNDNTRARRKRRKESARSTPAVVDPIPVSRVKELQEECGARFSNSSLGENTCCVCDCFHPTTVILEKQRCRCAVLLSTMKAQLKPPPRLPRKLLAEYDASNFDSRLAGMLLSKRGITVADSGVVLQLCKACLTSLLSKKMKSPPKFAIANGLFVGTLPECYDDLTMTELAMVNSAQPTRFMTVVQRGKHTSIRSHAYYFRAAPSPPAAMLPAEVISSGIIGVTMVGAMTPKQKVKTLKRYQVRVPRLFSQLDWYRENNHLYNRISVSGRLQVEAFTRSTSAVLDGTSSNNEVAGLDNI